MACSSLLFQLDHRTAVFRTCQLRIISFVSNYSDHVRSVGWNSAKIFCHHDQFIFLLQIANRQFYCISFISKTDMFKDQLTIQEKRDRITIHFRVIIKSNSIESPDTGISFVKTFSLLVNFCSMEGGVIFVSILFSCLMTGILHHLLFYWFFVFYDVVEKSICSLFSRNCFIVSFISHWVTCDPGHAVYNFRIIRSHQKVIDYKIPFVVE